MAGSSLPRIQKKIIKRKMMFVVVRKAQRKIKENDVVFWLFWLFWLDCKSKEKSKENKGK